LLTCDEHYSYEIQLFGHDWTCINIALTMDCIEYIHKVHVYRTVALRHGVVKFVDTILYVKCLCLIRK